MEKEYWLERWEHRQIGFDQQHPNPLLVRHFSKLNISRNGKIFVPLTGKTIDVAWLLSQGFEVTGCELSEQAVRELFGMLDIEAAIEPWEYGKIYTSERLTLFVGDFFSLIKTDLGTVDGVYDRAALVALPSEARHLYTSYLRLITQQAPQLLIVFDYDQELISGPPFSISKEEITNHYAEEYHIALIEKKDIPGGLKGVAPATEDVWLVRSKPC
ncbi:MAG: thiopurine S-methyltransferase [Bacteroidota bacterium]